jgi:hypothetical protein
MESFRKPDLAAPRFRREDLEIDNKEFYENLCKKYPNVAALGRQKVMKYIREFNELSAQAVIDNRDGLELLESLGNIFIGSCRAKEKDNVDYAKSKQYGVKVLHKNWDTEGKIGKIMYSNYGAKYRLKSSAIWVFKPCRHFSRDASKAFKANWQNYIVITKNDKVSALITSSVKAKDRNKQRVDKAFKTYNEFDFK